MTRTLLLLAVAAVISAPAVAGTPTQQSQPAAKSDKPEDKIVCKFVNTTGSRLSRDRECKSRAQWERESEAQADEVNDASMRPTGEATNGPH